jgi:hypothetical protein
VEARKKIKFYPYSLIPKASKKIPRQNHKLRVGYFFSTMHSNKVAKRGPVTEIAVTVDNGRYFKAPR